MLKHMSQFNLKYAEGDPEWEGLLQMMWERVSALHEAKEVRLYRQINPANPFDYCIEVTLPEDDPACLERYLNNPAHDLFCKEVWEKYVANQLDLNIASLF